MAPSLLNSLRYNFSGQLLARIVSFAINMYLLRVVDTSVLGLVNVRLTLLYDTILFLTREPLRKSQILKNSLPKFVNLLWLSPLISFGVSIVVVPLWLWFSSSPVPLVVLLSFPLSAWIESLAEPFAVISLRFSLDKHFAMSQALLLCLKRIVVLVFILFSSVDHLLLFATAQVLSAVVFVLFHLYSFRGYANEANLVQFGGFRGFFPQPNEGFDDGSLKAVRALFSHSVLKELLTDGSAFVMTFTELLSLKEQAVYDAVERVGSLAARVILAPMEESCFAYFSNAMNKDSAVFTKNSDSHDTLIRTFSSILHDVIVVGLVVGVFGIPYSGVAVSIYGGDLLAKNGGAKLLATYAFYILISAINGITECFAFASMNSGQIFSHGGFLLFSAIAHLSLSWFLCQQFGAIGFILANMINMLARIIYSWRHISMYLGARTPSIFSLVPSFSTLTLMMFTLMATSFSLLLFGMTPGLSHTLSHLAIGGVLFLLLAKHVYHHEALFQQLLANAKRD